MISHKTALSLSFFLYLFANIQLLTLKIELFNQVYIKKSLNSLLCQ